MASALEKILKGTLQKSDSQKAFSPWWEDLEDKLLYSLMIFGMITLPFNMVSNTPVECTIDPEHADNVNSSSLPTYRYHHFYLRKFCTLNFISEQMVFLPFILILAPLPLVAIGKLFLSFFKVEKRMNSFYKLLVKESLDREDVDAMEKENIKDCHEIVQMFRKSNGVYHSLLCRTFVQMVFGTGIGLVLLRVFLYDLSGPDIGCDLFGKHYTCVVPLANFYWTIVLLSCISMMVYVFCVVYNLIWLVFPRLSPLYGFMIRSRRHIDKSILMEQQGHEKPNFTRCLPMLESADPFFDLYFDCESRDLPLLITLLGTRNGVAETLRLLSLFDKDYQKLWKPLEVRIFHESVNENEPVVCVEWNDAPIAGFINRYRGRVCRMQLEYTLEIVPNSEAPIKSKMYSDETNFVIRCLGPKKVFVEDAFKYKESFYGVEFPKSTSKEAIKASRTNLATQLSESNEKEKDSDKKKSEIKIIISTEVNGRTIAQRTEKVPPPPLIIFGDVKN